MLSPLLPIGIGASVLGGIISRNDALENAKRQAEARNASLAANVAKLNGFGDTNEGVFGSHVAGYAPDAQAQQLDSAQGARSDVNTRNIAALDPASAPLPADASPASRSDLAKRMLAVHDAAVERAKATGKLGGYTDSWATNAINNAQGNRDIGVTNSYAEGRKALIGPEGDLAAAAATKTPSIWGSVLSGAGSLTTMYGGSQLGAPSVWDGGTPLPGGAPIGQGGIGSR